MKDVMRLVEEYLEKHEGASVCGAEYVYQDDEAQVDAIQLVADICDLYANY